MHVGFRGSFFPYGVLDPYVVSRFQIFEKEAPEVFYERVVGHVGGSFQRNAFFIEKRVERSDTVYGADSFVTIERGEDFESVLEPIPAFLIDLHSEPLSQCLLVVHFTSMAKNHHLQTGHGAVVRFLVEEGVRSFHDRGRGGVRIPVRMSGRSPFYRQLSIRHRILRTDPPWLDLSRF